MRWAFKRQLFFALAVLVILLLLFSGGWYFFFYHSPTCFDGAQNGSETGVDCGGSCAKICQAPAVTALWVRAVPAGPGVYHAVALVRNPRSDAGTMALPYHFSLYDANNILVAERSGTMYLEPAEVAPLFEPDIVTGNRTPTHAFIDFGQSVWTKMTAPPQLVKVDSQTSPADIMTTQSLSARVTNLTAVALSSTVVTALLFDASGNLVNASQTVVANLPPLGTQNITFTWQQPFTATVTQVELTPRSQTPP